MKIQFPTKVEQGIIPFEFLGVVKYYNGVDITQTPDYIKMSCKNYIKRLVKSHGWDTISKLESTLTENMEISLESNFKKEVDMSMMPSTKISPLPSDCIDQLFKDEGPAENTNGHLVLEKSSGFSYRTLLGELMYSYITCHLDIGYAVTKLSKFSSTPSTFHYKLLKGVAKYLRSTIDWGIHFQRPKQLNHPEFSPSIWYNIDDTQSSSFDIDINQPILLGFVDAAHENNLQKRRYTKGLVYTFCGGAIVYKSKTQSITAGSSTEAEFIAAYTDAKIARYLCMVLKQLGYQQNGPTPIHIDNLSALKIINENTSPNDQT